MDYRHKYKKYKQKYLGLKNKSLLQYYKIGQKEYQFRFQPYLDIKEGTDILFLESAMIVITKQGKVYYVENYQTRPVKKRMKVNLDPSFIFEGYEEGLLGVAKVHDKFYLAYTIDPKTPTEEIMLTVDEFTLDDSSKLIRQKTLLRILFDTNYHHGGHLVEKNNLLYLGTGDGGPQGDPNNRAQDLKTLRGKIIQIHPETGQTKIIAYGLRQPWLFSFDSQDRLWIGDVGWDTSESVKMMTDINKLYNFGWNYYEGSIKNKTALPDIKLDFPIWEYPTSDQTGRSIIGGFYLDEFEAYIFGDYLGFVRAIKLVDHEWILVAQDRLTQGLIYALAYDGHQIYILTDQKIYTLSILLLGK